MASKRLWEARLVIDEIPNVQVRDRLLGVWLQEVRQCLGMGRVSMLYSVLPWEQYDHLGAGVMLLYTSQLFGSSLNERRLFIESGEVSEEELDEVVHLGRRMLETEQLSSRICPAVKQLLDRIVSSPYFNAEQPGGLVLDALDDMLETEQLSSPISPAVKQLLDRIVSSPYFNPEQPGGVLGALDDMLAHSKSPSLRRKLQDLYTPTQECSVFGYLSWEQVKGGALTSLGNRKLGRPHAKAIALGLMDVEKKVKVLKPSWHACLRAMNSSRFVKDLLTTRPPKSTAPHSHALLDCIEHTWLWMLNSNLDVYSTVHGVKYSMLGNHDCDNKGGLMYRRFDGEVLPREVEKTMRRMAIEAYLADAPEPQLDPSNDPHVWQYLKYMKMEYIDRGFNTSYLPVDDNVLLARDAQDLDEHAKKCWLWNWDFRGVHLHIELLRKAGVNDEELEDLEKDLAVMLKAEPVFDNRHKMLVPDIISPLDHAKHVFAPDLYFPLGPRHKLRRW